MNLRHLSVGLSLIAAVALAACGGGSAPAGTAASRSPAEAASSLTSASASAPASASSKPVEISLHYPIGVSGPLAKIIDGYMGEFNKQNLDIKVTPVYDGSYPDTIAKVLQLSQAGTPADVAVVNAAGIYSMLDADAIIPLDDLIAKSGGSALLNDFFPAFMQNSQHGGKTWSLPWQRSTLVMYYNQDLFKEVGIEKAPQTWDELVQDGQKLVKKDASGKVVRWGVAFPSDGTSYWEFQALAIAAGQNVFDNNAGNKVFFNAPATVQALQFLLDLNRKYGVSPGGTVSWNDAPTQFAAGQVGIIFHSTGSLTNILKTSKFRVGVAFIPKNKQFGTPTGGGNLYIMKGIPADHQAAAWKLIQWMTSPERQARWSIDSGYVAARKSSYDTQLLKDYVAKYPQALVARDQIPYAQNELGTHQMAQVQQILSDAIQAGVTGQSSPKDALDQAQSKAEGILSQYKD